MTAINIASVNVLNNPASFRDPLQFEISYECLFSLQHDLEWKMTWVGSADTEKYDQVLDSVLVGPVVPGQYRFVFQADAPDGGKLPQQDIVGVTVLLLTCLYQDVEFLRIGYYVNSDYTDEEMRLNPPPQPKLDLLERSILAENPRVTKFPCLFDQPEPIPGATGEGETSEMGLAEGTLEEEGMDAQTGGASQDSWLIKDTSDIDEDAENDEENDVMEE